MSADGVKLAIFSEISKLYGFFLLGCRNVTIFARRNNSAFGSSSVIPVARKGLASVCRIVEGTVFSFQTWSVAMPSSLRSPSRIIADHADYLDDHGSHGFTL